VLELDDDEQSAAVDGAVANPTNTFSRKPFCVTIASVATQNRPLVAT
jgi:hypothetical protein